MSDSKEYVDRLGAVRARFAALAEEEPAPGALTEPDEPSGERWEWGQVWAHLAEFPAYWMHQLEPVLAGPAGDPPPFGRTKTDPGRIGAIERARARPVRELHGALEPQLEDLRRLIEGLSGDQWSRRVSHSTLGIMDMPRVLEVFLVGHLEQHADQLDGLLAGSEKE